MPKHLAARRCRFAAESNGWLTPSHRPPAGEPFGLLSYPLDGPLLLLLMAAYGIGVLWVVVLVRLSRVPVLILRSVQDVISTRIASTGEQALGSLGTQGSRPSRSAVLCSGESCQARLHNVPSNYGYQPGQRVCRHKQGWTRVPGTLVTVAFLS